MSNDVDTNVLENFSKNYESTKIFSTLLEAWDSDKDGKITATEFGGVLDRSKDSQNGIMRVIMEIFFSILGGADGVVDVKADAPFVPDAARRAYKQITDTELGRK